MARFLTVLGGMGLGSVQLMSEVLVLMRCHKLAALLYRATLPATGKLRPAFLIGLGHVYQRAEQPRLAEEYYKEALKIDESASLPHIMLAHLAEEEGNNSLAASHYHEALILGKGYSPEFKQDLENHIAALGSRPV